MDEVIKQAISSLVVLTREFSQVGVDTAEQLNTMFQNGHELDDETVALLENIAQKHRMIAESYGNLAAAIRTTRLN